MKIGIVGSGAVGSLFAAHLAGLEDVETWVYDVSQPHVDAINTNGLRLTGVGEVHAHLHATTDPAELSALDFSIVATKGMHTRAAMEATSHAFERGAVCSVQNGIGNEEIIAEYCSAVIRGTTFPAGKMLEPGVVQWDTGRRYVDRPLRTATGNDGSGQSARRAADRERHGDRSARGCQGSTVDEAHLQRRQQCVVFAHSTATRESRIEH